MTNILEKLTKVCSCPKAWEREGWNYPKAEMGYFRCDNTGERWHNTVWRIRTDIEDADLVAEFDNLKEEFFNEVPKLRDVSNLCYDKSYYAEDDDHYYLWLELEHGYYWFRMTPRKGDYNLYLHCVSKKALEVEG